MNKKGIFFGLYLVVLTVFMMGMVIAFYMWSDGNQEAAIVSPRAVLVVEQDLNLFEIREKEIILKSLQEVDKDLEFGSLEFREELRNNFLEKAVNDLGMGKFVFNNLYYKNEKKTDWSQEGHQESFFKTVLYPEGAITFEDEMVVFKREEIGKKLLLEPKKSGISFGVDFEYNFDKIYYLDKDFKFVEMEEI